MSPIALSVTSFQLALNHTLNTPDDDLGLMSGVGAAAAAAAGAAVGAAWPAGAVVGCAAGFVVAAGAAAWGLPQAASGRPNRYVFRTRNCRREKVDDRGASSIPEPSPARGTRVPPIVSRSRGLRSLCLCLEVESPQST